MKEFLQDNLKVFVVPVDILNLQDLTTHEKMVYMVLRSFANPHKPEVFPSYETIARLGSMTRRHAITCVQKLVEKGLIKKEVRLEVSKNRKIKNTSNLYTLQTPKVVNVIHPPSECDSPPLVNVIHPPSEYSSPEHNHLTKSFRTKSLNNSQSVKESHLTIESETIKKAIAKNKELTDRLTDIESIYLTIKNEPGYSDALFIATLQKAIKVKIKAPFAQYLLKAMINNMNEQQNKQTTEKSKSKNDLPNYVKNQLAQTNKEVPITQELDKEKKKEGLDLLFQLEEIDKKEYQKRLNEL